MLTNGGFALRLSRRRKPYDELVKPATVLPGQLVLRVRRQPQLPHVVVRRIRAKLGRLRFATGPVESTAVVAPGRSVGELHRRRKRRTAAARRARHRHQQDYHPAGALARPHRPVRRRPGRLRRHRPHRLVPDLHVPVAVGRRQAHVRLHIRPGRHDVRVHVRAALGHDRLARSHVDVHVLRARLFVHARRTGGVARRLRQPKERVRRHRRAGRRVVEQFQRGPHVCSHVRQL